ncbi:hypothetical protein MFIFM68171_05283 [Madurella fahalii]|uniref:C3H1-type domain-containing protein n=1 Tax=Madurella fahalii TaxID=1157608 RepID=A0ABQ0GBC7_9PEZI
MDQGHGDSIGGWAPGGFAGEAWDHPFGGSALAFDQGGSADNGYPNPDFLSDAPVSHQLAGADAQPGLYRQFGYYDQGDAWSTHGEATAAPYGQDAALHPGYYAEQRHPNNVNQTVESRFALNIPPGNDFQAQLDSGATPETNAHAFGGGVVNGPGSVPNGYPQASVPQWQGPVPTGYGSGQRYENPIGNPQAANLSAPVTSGSPSPFFSSRASETAAIPTYQTEAQQQVPVNPRPAHSHFSAVLSGQPQQTQATAAQIPVSVAGSPLTAAQRPAQKAQAQQSQRTLQQGSQQPDQVERAVQQPAIHPAAGQLVFAQESISQVPPVHQPQSSSEIKAVAGAKHARAPESEPPQAVAKRAKLLAPVVDNHASPSAQSQPEATPDLSCTVNYEDASLLTSAQGRKESTWPGVPNLVIGPAPVQLQKGTPTKRYVTLSTKGGKDPLFPKLWRGWTPAESLGNHADAYQKATSDLDRQRADIRLKIEMKRAETEIPVDWWKKVLKDRLGGEAKQLEPPAEPMYTGIKAAETLRLHPSHASNQEVAADAYTPFYFMLLDMTRDVKNAWKAKAEGKASDLDPDLIKAQLELAIVEGLNVDTCNLLTRMSGHNKLPASFSNLLIRLINLGETNSPLVKAILRLFTRLTKVKLEQLETWKINGIRVKLEAQGDDEAKALIAQVYETARRNSGDGSGSSSDSPAGAENSSAKKKATQARAVSKQENSGSDLKKSLSTSKPTTPATDSKKLSATSSKTTTSANELNKAAGKPAQKMVPTSTGTKRPREDDASASDLRSSKKPATDAATSASAAASSVKSSSTVSKNPAVKPSTAAPAPVQTKSRSGLLLPGKARPATKATPKPEPTKAELQKNAAKTDKTPPSQATASSIKPAKPKPTEAAKETTSTRSAFSALMAEIDEPKKVNRLEPPSKVSPPPDPNETPEQRERRLRKEKRRALGLKVAFRSGDGLAEIREFTRHPEEIAEQEGHMARNVKTDGRYKNNEESEMMKKLHGGKGFKASEINDREWEEPVAIDFGDNIPNAKREQTYDTRGGLKTFETDEQKLIRERESMELMAIYHNPADIPPNPRSPPYEPSLSGAGASGTEVLLPPATPEREEMMQRANECRQWGSYHGSRAALGRLEAKSRPDYADFTKAMKSINSIADSYNGHSARQPEVRAQAPVQDARTWYDPAVAARRDQQTYELLTSDRLKNWNDPNPYDPTRPKTDRRDPVDNPEVQKVLDSLEATARQVQREHAAKTAQAASAPQPTQPEVAQPVAVAVTAQPAQIAAPDHSAAWAQYYAAQQQQQQSWYGQQQNPYTQAVNPYAAQVTQPQPQPQPQNADSNNQLSSILAALSSQQAATQAQYPSVDPNQIQALMAALAGSSQTQVQAQAAAPAAADPQSAQYLLDIMKWASAAQNQGQSQGGQPAASYPYQDAYGQNQGYGPSHPERDGYSQPHQERDRDGYGGGRSERDRDHNRDRDRDWDRDRDYHLHNRGGHGSNAMRRTNSNNSNDRDGKIPDHLRGINRSLIGTKQCAFWAKGQCAKGDKCTFRHD